MKAQQKTETRLSDHAKVAIIFNQKPVYKEWIKGDLTKEEKQQILDGMDVATDGPWLLGLIEDIRDLRKGA